ncbi:hypothetical protein HYW58_02155 [Candidatus Kaiserbacteria bacterium]|nr:hypothetical protein [Candidatus Kaiserbacteria bacterium]
MTTNKEQLNNVGFKTLNDLKRNRNAKDYIIRITSGTSGSNPVALARTRSNKVGTGPLFFYQGMRRVIAFWGTLNARLSRATQFLFYPEDGDYTVLAVDSRDLRPDLNDIFRDFKPEGLCGFPSFVVRALSFIHDTKILRDIRAVSFSGEALSEVQESFLRHKLPNATLENHYASAEIGCISGKPCGYLLRNQYHPHGRVTLENVNLDSDGVGELLVSYHLGPSVYVNRYATGDAVRFLNTKCACGNPITFELLGRKNFDFIKFLGATFLREEFERVMSELSRYVKDYRGEAREIALSDTLVGELTLKVVGTPAFLDKKDRKEFLRDEISKRLFVTPSKTYANLVAEGLFLPLKIEITGSFEHCIKTVKLRRI